MQVIDDLFVDPAALGEYLTRFFVLLVLSTVIAALGLVADSVAVVIGAMLLAPLMTPILAVAAALVLGDLRQLARSVAVLVSGVAASVVTATAVTWMGLGNLTVASALPPEIVARTEPSLLDLGVAVAAGLAAGYVITHRRVVSSLPGVAIAVALVPPLATVGITLELGRWDAARGSMLLFLTNLVAIVLSAILVMRASGVAPDEVRRKGARSVRVGVVVTSILLVAIAVPLTLHTRQVVLDRVFAQTVGAEVVRLDPNAVIEQLQATVTGPDHASVTVLIATSSRELLPAWELAEALAAETGRTVDVDLQVEQDVRDAATSG